MRWKDQNKKLWTITNADIAAAEKLAKKLRPLIEVEPWSIAMMAMEEICVNIITDVYHDEARADQLEKEFHKAIFANAKITD